MTAVLSTGLIAGMAAGCGDGDSTAPTISVVENTASPGTTPLETVTVVPFVPTDVAAETLAEPLDATSTIPGETPEEAARAGVLAAVGDAEQAMYSALRSPQWSEAEALGPIEAATAVDSPAREQLVAAVRANRAGGRAAVAHDEFPSSVTIDGDVRLLDQSTATVEVCVVDSETFVTTDASGRRAVVGEGTVASRVVETFVLGNSRWLLSRFEILEQFPGGTSCPDG